MADLGDECDVEKAMARPSPYKTSKGLTACVFWGGNLSLHNDKPILKIFLIAYMLAHMFPTLPLMSSSGEVVAAALGAAQHRRERVEMLCQKTPGSSRSGATKRKTNPRQDAHGEGSVSTAASTSVPSEKITPDPKHVRTDAPEPKVLFGSPDDHRADGCDKTEGWNWKRVQHVKA